MVLPGSSFATAPTTNATGPVFVCLGTNSLTLVNLAFTDVPKNKIELFKVLK